MTKEQKAHKILDLLSKNITKFNKDVKFITVQIENCTLYIPVNNLDESIVPEFRKQFKVVYDLTQGR